MERPLGMMRAVSLYATTAEGQEVAATVSLHPDKSISVKAAPGYDALADSLLETDHYVPALDRHVSRKNDPVAWFESLPVQYNGGSMLRASRPKDEDA
jgi:hypothetical protein